MVLGTGLMASVFAAFSDDDHFRVIAAGVSNSGERSRSAFLREQNMIEAMDPEGGCVVYLSTCSIFDPTLERSAYVEHKRRMEDLVLSRFHDRIVLRLPNILGRSANPNTLLNYFRDRILARALLEVQMEACRYVMDRRDLSRAVPWLLAATELRGRAVNVCYDEPVPVPQLLKVLEMVLGMQGVTQPVRKGACYHIENLEFRALLSAYGVAQPNASDLEESIRDHYGPEIPAPEGTTNA